MYELTISGINYNLRNDMVRNNIDFSEHYDTVKMQTYLYDIPVTMKTMVFFKERYITPSTY